MTINMNSVAVIILLTLIEANILRPSVVSSAEPEARRLLRITAAVDQKEGQVGKTMVITESVPSKLDPVVSNIIHKSTQIGDWDQKTKEFVLREAKEHTRGFAPDEFDGLWALNFAHGGWFDDMDPLPGEKERRSARTFKFKPKEPGIYLLYAEWSLRKSSVIWVSNPVVVMVRGD